MPTCAARRRSWRTCPAPSRAWVSTGPGCTPRSSVPRARRRRGSHLPRPGRRTRPRARPAHARTPGPQIALARSSLTVPWDQRYASLLELAEACDEPVRWSCRTGVCHTCETALLSGTVGYSPDPVEEPAGGSALICCSQPRGDLVLDL